MFRKSGTQDTNYPKNRQKAPTARIPACFDRTIFTTSSTVLCFLTFCVSKPFGVTRSSEAWRGPPRPLPQGQQSLRSFGKPHRLWLPNRVRGATRPPSWYLSHLSGHVTRRENWIFPPRTLPCRWLLSKYSCKQTHYWLYDTIAKGVIYTQKYVNHFF